MEVGPLSGEAGVHAEKEASQEYNPMHLQSEDGSQLVNGVKTDEAHASQGVGLVHKNWMELVSLDAGGTLQ